MSVRVRAKFGGAHTLCKRCEHCIHMADDANNETVKCTVFHRNLSRPVVECSAFDEKGSQSLWDMERRAWILEVKGDRIIGFKKRKDEDE